MAGDSVHYRDDGHSRVAGREAAAAAVLDDGAEVSDWAKAGAYGAPVAAVARRHHLDAKLIFTWMHDPQFAERSRQPTLLPVEIVPEQTPSAPTSGAPSVQRGQIEIDTPGGMRLRCHDTVEEAALVRVLSAMRHAS